MAERPQKSRSMLCADCCRILQHLRGVYFIDHEAPSVALALHHASASGLKAAAERGCQCCCVFWHQFTASQKEGLLLSDAEFAEDKALANYLGSGAWDGPDGASRTITEDDTRNYFTNFAILPPEADTAQNYSHMFGISLIDEGRLSSENLKQRASLFILQPEPEIASNDSNTASVRYSSNTGAEQPWSLAQKWIDDCLSTHTTCNTRQDESWNPTRLLDLETNGKTIRLVETADHACIGSYITLSHRWSLKSWFKLCRATYDRLCHGVPVDELPQAFSDAITICRRLKVRYLWIDALCIKQDHDDLSDWMKEASLMHKVYSNSFLNISALAALDCTQSFFVDRDTASLTEASIDTTLVGLELGQEMKRYRVRDFQLWERHIDRSHLNLRGWVLQERLLAPRVLHFGRHQLLWECRECHAAESFPDGLPAIMSDLGYTSLKSLDLESHKRKMQKVNVEDPPEMAPYRLWARIVDVYSKCELTNGQDKLIALSGIVKKMAARMNDDDYIAGMWRRYLSSELLWNTHTEDRLGDKSPQRATEYRAPSFSWASVDGVVQAGSPCETGLLIDILDVNLVPVTKDRTGLIQSGDLVLRGRLQKLSIGIRSDMVNAQEVNVIASKVFFGGRKYVMFVNGVEARVPSCQEWVRVGPRVFLDEDERYFDPVDRTDLFCVPARSWQDEEFLDVLLLQLLDTEAGVYRRFGLARASEKYDQAVLRAQNDSDAELPSMAFENGLHTIRIV